MQAAALCRSSHALFDDETVWQDRVAAVEDAQRAGGGGDAPLPVPAAAVLSPAQLPALPPLPSLSEAAAALCERLRRPREGLNAAQARVTSIVHLPSTLRYHAKVLKPYDARFPLEQVLHYLEFSLTYSPHRRRWMVASTGDYYSGIRAINAGDNVGQEEEKEGQGERAGLTSGLSSKRRYVQLLQCSEHAHNACYRLLPPSLAHCAQAPGSDDFHYDPCKALPPLRLLPLCRSCRGLLARCIERGGIRRHVVDYRVLGIHRINALECTRSS